MMMMAMMMKDLVQAFFYEDYHHHQHFSYLRYVTSAVRAVVTFQNKGQENTNINTIIISTGCLKKVATSDKNAAGN